MQALDGSRKSGPSVNVAYTGSPSPPHIALSTWSIMAAAACVYACLCSIPPSLCVAYIWTLGTAHARISCFVVCLPPAAALIERIYDAEPSMVTCIDIR